MVLGTCQRRTADDACLLSDWTAVGCLDLSAQCMLCCSKQDALCGCIDTITPAVLSLCSHWEAELCFCIPTHAVPQVHQGTRGGVRRLQAVSEIVGWKGVLLPTSAAAGTCILLQRVAFLLLPIPCCRRSGVLQACGAKLAAFVPLQLHARLPLHLPRRVDREVAGAAGER